jgi:hypothetical protein
MEGGGFYIGAGQVVGIVHRGEGLPLHFVHLRRSGDHVHLLAHGSVNDLAGLVKAVGTRLPWVVVLDGQRVVNRVFRSDTTAREALPLAFPNAPLDQLVVDGRTEGGYHGLSMMRADQVEPLLAALRGLGARVVDVAVGPWGLLDLEPLLDDDAFADPVGGYRFVFNDGALCDHHRAELRIGPVRVGDEQVPDAALLAWAMAWAHLVPSAKRMACLHDRCAMDRKQERARLWYERLLIGGAALILLLLGVDLTLRHLSSSAERSPLRAQHTAALGEVEDLRAQVAEREGLLAQLGTSPPGSLTERMAAVLTNVPRGIRLDRLWVDPLSKPLREREPVTLQVGHILVEGTCSDPALLNDWMTELQRMYEGGDVQLNAYGVTTGEDLPRFQLTMAP